MIGHCFYLLMVSGPSRLGEFAPSISG